MPAPEDLVSFCAREHPRLVGALSLYCGDAGVAEELAQEALERACARWTRVREMESPGAWVHRVAMNLANSHFRRGRAERRALRRAGVPEGFESVDVAGAMTVRRAVVALPARQRAAVVLRYFAGFSVEEAAAVLEVRPGALKALTHRAMQALRTDLDVGGVAKGTNDVC